MTHAFCAICLSLKPHPLLLADLTSNEAQQRQRCAACGWPYGFHLAVHPHQRAQGIWCPGFQTASAQPVQLEMFPGLFPHTEGAQECT